MCGIVGGVSNVNIEANLVSGLQALEYRGYDSAGIAVIKNKSLKNIRCVGKVQDLINKLAYNPIEGYVGIAHTRWATHGKPSKDNAHPHISHNDVAVVHNGIIENHAQLHEKIKQFNIKLESETDTEIISHLIYVELNKGKNLFEAVSNITQELKGAFALGVISIRYPDQLIAVRQGSPLVIGVANQSHFIASDPIALLDETNNFIYLEEGDIAQLTPSKIAVFSENKKVQRAIKHFKHSGGSPSKGGYPHFMIKEIYDQPKAIRNAIKNDAISHLQIKEEIVSQIESIEIVACGSSYHAGYTASYWITQLLKLPCYVEFASEYRYRNRYADKKKCLYISLSQSGETADTLAALSQAKKLNYLTTLAICNVAGSSLVRESDDYLLTTAGVEISVAATKSFTAQLFSLLSLILHIGKYKQISVEELASINNNINKLPAILTKYLELDSYIKNNVATSLTDISSCLFFARSSLYPIMLEGALKLQEIAYIDVHAYPGGELKHGPLALVTQGTTVISMVTNDEAQTKMYANLSEVSSRGVKLWLFIDENCTIPHNLNATIIKLPSLPNKFFAPIAYVLPLQLLAYHVSVCKGTDTDQPRNLAKSVTVE